MNDLLLDWDSDFGEIELVPLRGNKLYEGHRWERFDLPVWSNFSNEGSDADSVLCSDVTKVFAEHLPKFDRTVEHDWTAKKDFILDKVVAFGFNREFAAVISSADGNAGDTGSKLQSIEFFTRRIGSERRELWLLIMNELAHLPILVYSSFVMGQCLIGDRQNLERIWDAIVEDTKC